MTPGPVESDQPVETRCREILEKLRPALEQEGLEAEVLGVEGSTLNIRVKRTGPGVPVAFMVRAISGTFHRYLPEIQDVCLVEYDPGEQQLKSSPEFDKVFKHRPKSAVPPPRGVPGVDLSGLSRADAVRAIEAFVRMWSEKVDRIKLAGLSDDAPLRAARKWADVYSDQYHSIDKSDQEWTVHFNQPGEAVPDEPVEMMPGSILLV